MRKTVVILLSIALLVSLAGCHNVTPSGSSSIFNSPSSELLSAASSEDTSAMTATNGTPENHITYIESGNDYYALSYMKQGVQILKGVKGIDWDVAEIEPNVPKGKNLEKHYVPVMKSNGEKISPEEKLWYSNAGKVVSSNGSWDFFPKKVCFEEYTLDNQPDKPEWKKYFLSKIQEKSDDTPVIYLFAYFFDWNGDGIEDAFVNASNMIYTTDDKPKPNPPYAEKTSVYMLSALFLSGNEPFETPGFVSDYIPKEQLEDEGVFYNVSKEYWGSSFISAIQYDANGDLMICPVYEDGYWFEINEDTMTLCDIDGDGKSEWIVFNLGEYTGIIIYKLKNEKPIEVFRTFEGA